MKTLKSEEGASTLDYLRNERGFSDEAIDAFHVGFCPQGAGHQLAGRIITPIYNPYGTAVALSTRFQDKDHPSRFWHESFEKGYYLYGLHLAKHNMIKFGKAVLVEGEFDVICLHSFGINVTVGICGSAFSIYQAALLSRYCSEIYLVLDSDISGQKTVERAKSMFQKYGMALEQLKFITVVLPPKMDPDDYVIKYGRVGFIRLLQQSRNKAEDLFA